MLIAAKPPEDLRSPSNTFHPQNPNSLRRRLLLSGLFDAGRSGEDDASGYFVVP